MEAEKELPKAGFITRTHIKKSLLALRGLNKKKSKGKKDLLESGDKVFVEIVFKNIPANCKTFVHTVVLPNHPRLLEDDPDIALFVRHIPPRNEAEKIQFTRDRELDLENTRSYYKEMFEKKLDEPLRSKISKIISLKELATEYNTYARLNKLAGSYDLFLSDHQLMANKMNPLPRRLGRRFWVKEKKVPLLIKLDKKDLNERFTKVLKTEPFYVLGRSASEQLQVGTTSQPVNDVVENIQVFLKKLYNLYGSGVRLIRFKTNPGLPLTVYADLDPVCPKVKMSFNMSLMFKPPAEFDPNLVQVMFNENALLIKIVTEYQNKGKVYECMKYQEILTRNLLYLSNLSDFQAEENFSFKQPEKKRRIRPIQVKKESDDNIKDI